MSHRTRLGVGIVGTIAAIVCCVTPFLPWFLASIGLSGVIGYVYNDAVLLPVLAICLVFTGYAFWRWRQSKSS